MGCGESKTKMSGDNSSQTKEIEKPKPKTEKNAPYRGGRKPAAKSAARPRVEQRTPSSSDSNCSSVVQSDHEGHTSLAFDWENSGSRVIAPQKEPTVA